MNTSEAARWMQYARSDLEAARVLHGQSGNYAVHVCSHAQQCAEKELKAVLEWLEYRYPYSHDLDRLRDLIPDGWRVKTQYPDLAALTIWAIGARYPSVMPDATEEEAQDALKLAAGVFNAVETDLRAHAKDTGESV